MLELVRTLKDPKGIVQKLIFEDEEDPAVVEAVVYKYSGRGVVCVSVQSGCRIGCSFCGTGKRFIRNLTAKEIIYQISWGLSSIIEECRKIQIMTMSMGEPFHNFDEVYIGATHVLEDLSYEKSPILMRDTEFHYYVSTVAPREMIESHNMDLLRRLFKLKRFGLQFSLHNSNEKERRKLLGNYDGGYLSFDEIKAIALEFNEVSGNRAYFNYIVPNSMIRENEIDENILEAARFVESCNGHLTLSVLCDTKAFTKANPEFITNLAIQLSEKFPNLSLSTFDPAGQDTIGGGCGQLLFVQERMKELN